MKTNNTRRRCEECSGEYIPRGGNRQVTCGAAECQRRRHSRKCRAWRAANAEYAGSHYADAVLPFRQRQPSYQRRWRLGRRLREIREESSRPSGGLLGGLRSLLGRAEALMAEQSAEEQSGVLSANLLDRAATAVRGAIAAAEQLAASLATLGAMGL